MRTQFNLRVKNVQDAKKALSELEKNLVSILDAHRLGIMLFNSCGDVLTCNKQWERLYLLDYEQVKDYNMLEDRNLQRKHIWHPIQGAFNGTAGKVDENYFSPEEWGKQGRARWTEGHCLPLFDTSSEDERQIGAGLFLQDVTDRKMTALEVEKVRKKLTEIQSKQEDIYRRICEMAEAERQNGFARSCFMPSSQHVALCAPTIPRREREVFEKLAEGYSVKEAAHQLGLGIKSVYTYRSRLLKRLRLNGDVELALAWREIQRKDLEPDAVTVINSD